MPRKSDTPQDNAGKVRQYARQNRLAYDVAYHLALLANAKDGRGSTGLDPNAPSIEGLSAENAAALTAARSALGL
jgi:hypothetical protein